jgi:tetratricopeptide (TPR) repeat protein
LYLQLGQTHETLEHYQRCLEIFQKLAAAEPGEAEAQRNQSVLYNCLGDLTLRHGRATEAFAHYQRGLEISEMLAVDRGDARAQRDLFISYPNSATSHCV